MKFKSSILKLALLLFMTLTNSSTQAQIFDNSSNYNNRIKTNIISYLVYHTNLSYERSISNNWSANLQLSYRPFSNLSILYNTLLPIVSFGSSGDNYAYNSLSVSPEMRYYVKQSMHGFYIAGYARFRTVDYAYDYSIANRQGIILNGPVNGAVNSHLYGVMIGTSFSISDRINLDVYWGGLHYAINKAEQEWTSPINLTEEEQLLFGRSFPLLITSHSTADYTQTTQRDIYSRRSYNNLGVRATGLSLCYNF